MSIKNPNNILVIHHWGRLGDAIIFAATSDKLHRLYPDANLTWIGSKKAKALRPLLPDIKEAYFVSCSEQSDIKHKWQRLFTNLQEAFALVLLIIKLTLKNKYDMVIYPKRMALFKVCLLPILALLNIPIRIGFDDGKLSSTFFTHTVPDAINNESYIANNYLKLLEPLTQKPVTYQAPHLSVPDETVKRVQQKIRLQENKSTNLRIVLHPGVGQNINSYYQKAWPVSHWKILITCLLAQYPQCELYLSSGPDDVETMAEVNEFITTLTSDQKKRILDLASLKLSFDEYAAALLESDVVVVADTGILHLAMGLGIPVVTIFTSTNEKLYTYETSAVSVVKRDDLNCRPCLWVYQNNTCETPECLNVPVPSVMQAIENQLTLSLGATIACEITALTSKN